MKEAITDAVDIELNKYLSDAPQESNISEGVTMFSKTTKCSYKDDQISWEFFSFTYKNQNKDDIFRGYFNTNLPKLSKVKENEIDLVLSSYFINANLNGFLKAESFKFLVTNTQLPPNTFEMNSKIFGPLFKGLNRWNTPRNVQIECTILSPTDISFVSNSISYKTKLQCDFFVERTSKRIMKKFSSLQIEANGSLQLLLKKGLFYPLVETMNVQKVEAVFEESYIKAETEAIKTMVNFGIGIGIEVANNALANGIDTPVVNGISFKKPELKIEYGYLKMRVEPVFGEGKYFDTDFFNNIILRTIKNMESKEILKNALFSSAVGSFLQKTNE